MAKNQSRSSEQKGPQQHAEGQHGEKTHQAFLEQLHSADRGERHEGQRARGEQDLEKGSRLEAGLQKREQHDDADLNSHKNRLGRELQKEGRDEEIDTHPDLKGGFGMNRRGS